MGDHHQFHHFCRMRGARPGLGQSWGPRILSLLSLNCSALLVPLRDRDMVESTCWKWPSPFRRPAGQGAMTGAGLFHPTHKPALWTVLSRPQGPYWQSSPELKGPLKERKTELQHPPAPTHWHNQRKCSTHEKPTCARHRVLGLRDRVFETPPRWE